MQTTLRLDDELYRQAKARAAAQGISLTRFLEEAVRERLNAPQPTPRRRRLRLPVSSAAGGLVSGFSTLEDAVAAADLAHDRCQEGQLAVVELAAGEKLLPREEAQAHPVLIRLSHSAFHGQR